MALVTYISDAGSATELDVPLGVTLMSAATANGLSEIVGECGGSAMCATCHVYVEPEWLDRLVPMSATENEMLDATSSERRSNSRLSCQIKATEHLSGLVVHMPATQI